MTRETAVAAPPLDPLVQGAFALMQMHLLIDAAGRILSAGTTLRRFLGPGDLFDDSFEPMGGMTLAQLAQAERVFLRLRDGSDLVLRGRAVPVAGGLVLFNLGFGIGVVEAIRHFDLTDRDFAPNELVMELLFLHEANGAMTAELSRANLRLEEARSRAEAQAFTDPLTGLLNRRGLELAFDALRDGVMADPSRQFALVVLDLDHFKQLNDTRGHAAGDEMLRAVAARLGNVTRDEDRIARVGGDEFVLLLPDITEVAQLETLGARIVAAIEQPVVIRGAACTVSTSLGATLSGAFPVLSWAAMEAAADKALYAAKRAGRGCLRIARPVAGGTECLGAE